MAWSDRLRDLTTFFNRRRNKTKVYDTTKKQLDLSRMLDPDELYRIINETASGSTYGSTIFNKFFDINVGRSDRYSEYEQMYYRIPEVAAALHILVDLTLSPNVGDKSNELRYISKNGPLGRKAEEYSRTLFESTTVIDNLPKIAFNAFFYGDCFVSNRETNFGIQYTIHDTKETSILFDKSTGINLGIVERVPLSTESAMDRILSLACPSISLDVPRLLVGIVAGETTLKQHDYEVRVKEMEDLINEVLMNTNDSVQKEFKYFPPRKYTTFSIYYNDFYHPYGTSILDPLRATAKQLLLTEAALSIYRMTRAPLRYKFLVEVGSMPENKIRSMLNAIKDSIKRERVISEDSSSSIDTIPDIIAPEEDFWIPVVNGTPWLDISPLEGGNLDPFTGDVDYFRNKLIGGLGLPPSYLGQEEGTSTRALLTLEDMRLNRTIKKYQRDLNVGLTDLNDNNLMMANASELIGQVKVQLPPPQTLEDNVKVENIANRLNTATEFSNLFPNVPKLWIMKNIICMEQNSIDEMEESITEQSKYKIFAEHKPGEVGPEGEPIGGGMSGLGGLGSPGTGFGGGMDMGDFPTEEPTPDLSGVETGDSDLENIDFNKTMEDLGSEVANGPSGNGEMQL